MDIEAILDAAFRRVFGETPPARTAEGADTANRVKRRINDAREGVVAELANGGMSLLEASKALGLSRNTTKKLADRAGVSFVDGRAKRWAK